MRISYWNWIAKSILNAVDAGKLKYTITVSVPEIALNTACSRIVGSVTNPIASVPNAKLVGIGGVI
jgi:hypothetical protein